MNTEELNPTNIANNRRRTLSGFLEKSIERRQEFTDAARKNMFNSNNVCMNKKLVDQINLQNIVARV